MGLVELFILAVGLSMDAFAVSVTIGLTMLDNSIFKALAVGLYFGGFQAGMPIAGYFAGLALSSIINDYDHWAAFGMLALIGLNMVFGSKESDSGRMHRKQLSPAVMVPLAIATSIDALAVGISFAFLRVNIFWASSFIGVCTLLISMLGVKVGNSIGSKAKHKAQIIGGLILIGIGLKILLSDLLG
ncbi:MAG: manganese efflux pump MntP family protein [Eubacteriaceae bacterium]|jgi:putative Mn2+ efflux pump MntP|nr:manganese efflux pump MntP family protein [Eubacteriaceae bacterium]